MLLFLKSWFIRENPCESVARSCLLHFHYRSSLPRCHIIPPPRDRFVDTDQQTAIADPMTAINLTAIKQIAARPQVRKTVITTVTLLAVLWLAGCGVLYRIMLQPPETFARFMAKLPGPVPFLLFPFETLWTRARSGTLRPGD